MTADKGGGDWDARREALDARLGEHRARRRAEETSGQARTGGMRGMAQGLKIASEFVAGIAVGALIGFGIDYFAGTSPFGLIVFLLFGFAAGVLNVIRGSTNAAGPGQGRHTDS